jgi:hypothetical protein
MTVVLLKIPELFGWSIEVYVLLFFIALPTYFAWQRLFKKLLPDDGPRKIISWTATLIVTPCIYAGLVVLLMFGMTYTPGRNFNRGQWLRDEPSRFRMGGAIVKRKILVGRDTSGVKQLLGDPIWRNSTPNHEMENSWVYDMGMGGGGLGFLFHSLVIRFENNKVVHVEHRKRQD